MTAERVQKILSRAGLGSRRGCEKFIEAGRVTVNGKVISLGAKADPDIDKIMFDGQPITSPQQFTYYALYKPRGILSSTKSENNRKTVIDLIPGEENIYPVGRLDIESEGLMILTNDGDLTNYLTHPRFEHEKEYRVLVSSHPDQSQLDTWQRGLVLPDGYKTQPAQVRIEKHKGKGTWLRVIMTEGHKRQIRETTRQLGLFVVKLIRIRIASLELGGLKPGQYRPLTPKEIHQLKSK
jgi:23S rRNA pseudouridine2605 synthase